MNKTIPLYIAIIIMLIITACEDTNVIKDEDDFKSILNENFVKNENNIKLNNEDLIKQISKVKTIKEYSINDTVDDIDTVKFGTYP